MEKSVSTTTENKPALSKKQEVVKFFQREDVKNKFMEILGRNGAAFASSVLTLVNTNDKLQECSPDSLYLAAMMAATLNLPINPNLGFSYIIPYDRTEERLVKDDKGKETLQKVKVTMPQMQIGYKGFIQLCQRTGLFKTISACPIYAEQLISENSLTGYVFDFTKKPKPTYKPVGYAAFFSLINGFEKTEYWTIDEINEHAMKFSKSFNFGPWKSDFDAMAQKTVLKLLLKTYAPMTVEMNRAVEIDQAFVKKANDDGTVDVEYIDEGKTEINLDSLIALYEKHKDKLSPAALASIEDTIKNEKVENYEKHYNILKTR
jgi:recombination protein RecT